MGVIGNIEDALGVGDLYPLETIVVGNLHDRVVVASLVSYGLNELCDRIDGHNPIVAQVICVVAMAAGAAHGAVAGLAREAARGDERANDTDDPSAGERREAMDSLVATIDTYTGTPTAVVSPGLLSSLGM